MRTKLLVERLRVNVCVWFFFFYFYGLTKETKEEGLQTRIGILGGKGQGRILFLIVLISS